MTVHRRAAKGTPAELAAQSLGPEILSNIVAPLVETFSERLNRVEKIYEDRHAENVKRRHDLHGWLDQLGNRAHLLGERLTVVEHRLKAVDGGDSGTGGMISKLEQGQNRLDHKTAEVKSDLRSLLDSSPNNPQIQEMQAWKNKWLGVAAAVSIAGTVFALLSGVVAALWAVFRHVN